jgi:branched-chain amino acid transport system permease protein
MIKTILVNGMMTSALYALLACGFSLIFGVARIINLAQTAFYMVAAYSTFILSTEFGFNVPLSGILSVVFTTALGLIIYRWCIDRIREHETTVLLVTVALAIVFQECLLLKFGLYQRVVPQFIPGFVEILGVRVSYQHVIALVTVGAALGGIWTLLHRTKVGLATRAVAQDRETANLMGIEVRVMCLAAFGFAVLLAAIAGAVVAPIYSLDPFMWMHPLLMVCAIVVLGGLGSVAGSVVGALIMGYVETLVVFLVPMGSFVKTAVALMIMIAMLMIRPEGLFGVTFEEERL